jgi:hypothetical protein
MVVTPNTVFGPVSYPYAAALCVEARKIFLSAIHPLFPSENPMSLPKATLAFTHADTVAVAVFTTFEFNA